VFFEETRAALVALMGQPIAVGALVLLAGVNAAIWLLVFQRAGFPTALASLLLVPPLTFVLPLYFALARWPAEARALSFAPAARVRAARPIRRLRPRRPQAGPVFEALDHRWPVRLAADGLPRYRIPLGPTGSAPVGQERYGLRAHPFDP
jgi:hypothetical protein